MVFGILRGILERLALEKAGQAVQTCWQEAKIQTLVLEGDVQEGLCELSPMLCQKWHLFSWFNSISTLGFSSGAPWDLSLNMCLFDCNISLSGIRTSHVIALFRFLSCSDWDPKHLDCIQKKGMRNKKCSSRIF